ncbi:hypothetical protein GCM10010319_41480 [Streptomyces blastmyceticus]|uniref:Uncharacterized protein n=1 Tax=Streptomyces blastmyceticus TaxID=68180 RepID=A0ABP3H2R8_9ACTN
MTPLAQPLVKTNGSTDTPVIVSGASDCVRTLRAEYTYSEEEMSSCADGACPGGRKSGVHGRGVRAGTADTVRRNGAAALT